MFKVFASGFETRIKTITPLIDHFINEALTIFQSDAISAHWRPSLITDKLVPAYRFQLASPGFRILCGFHAARGESEWCTLLWCLAAQTVAAIHLLSCWWLTFQCTTRAQEHRAAVTQDSGLHSHHTWDLQQTTPQSSRLQDMDSHSGIHLSETTRDVKHRWLSCGYKQNDILYFTR